MNKTAKEAFVNGLLNFWPNCGAHFSAHGNNSLLTTTKLYDTISTQKIIERMFGKLWKGGDMFEENERAGVL